MKQISANIWVGSQITAHEIARLPGAGFTAVLNHRPDGEESGQPLSVELESAAQEAGLRYAHAPTYGLPGQEQAEITRRFLDQMGPEDRALLFCRSGMRSTAAWALAERMNGVDPDALRTAAANAGYDISRVPL